MYRVSPLFGLTDSQELLDKWRNSLEEDITNAKSNGERQDYQKMEVEVSRFLGKTESLPILTMSHKEFK